MRFLVCERLQCIPPSACCAGCACTCREAGLLLLQHLEDLDGGKFSKLCRDCKLLGRNMNTTDVDLIFASSKPKGHRKVGHHPSYTPPPHPRPTCIPQHCYWHNALVVVQMVFQMACFHFS